MFAPGLFRALLLGCQDLNRCPPKINDLKTWSQSSQWLCGEVVEPVRGEVEGCEGKRKEASGETTAQEDTQQVASRRVSLW